MVLNSFQFLALLLPGTAAVLRLLPQHYRVGFLLFISVLFCALWSPESVVILLILALLDFFAAKYLRGNRILLILCVTWNVGALAVFKYAGFFAVNSSVLLNLLKIDVQIPALSLILPLGISYYTFKKVSYAVDVYRGTAPVAKLWDFLLYVAFFPALLAGPMDRAQVFMSQLRSITPTGERFMAGYGRILWGCAKKMIIADQAAVFVRIAYDHPSSQSWLTLVIGTYLFAIQIYADFSGYCDMAIGSAKVLGLTVTENFTLPYAAVSIGDFWRRWHITLSQWFRDYVYIPLGGNRRSLPRQSLNLLIVFALSGLWHGAQWTFVAWGALHGIFLIISLWSKSLRATVVSVSGLSSRKKLHAVLQVIITFHLVTLTWIFFRAASLSDAITIIRTITTGIIHRLPAIVPWHEASFGIILVGTLIMIAAEARMHGSDLGTFLQKRSLWLQCSTYFLLFLLILSFGYFRHNPFIYAQF